MRCYYWLRVVFALLVAQVKPFHFFHGTNDSNFKWYIFCSQNVRLYFAFRNGYHCPATYNPADFLIGTLSKMTANATKSSSERDGHSIAQQLCNAFEECRQDKQMKAIDTFVIIEDDIKYDIRKPLWIYTVFLLIHRNFLIVTRDPTIQKLQIVQKIVSVRCSVYFSNIIRNCWHISFTGNRHNDGALFLWHNKTRPVRHTIGSRCIVYSIIGEHIHTNVFGTYALPETRSIIYA